jgi:pyruvate kinase
MDFSDDPEITIQNAINRLREEEWIHDGDQLVTVTNVFAHDKVVESIQLREVEPL